MSAKLDLRVNVHPLVLLSVVDHYTRVAKDTRKRVVGLLLGEHNKGVTEVLNSFALPFEEDEKDTSILYLDHSYLEEMFRMFKKVNAKERIIGWYSSGPRIREADMDIHRLVSRFCEVQNPVFVICEVQPTEIGLPVHGFAAVDDVRDDGTQAGHQMFVNLPTAVASSEAEEIGVEHLLRDVKDASVSTLAEDVMAKVAALRGLQGRLEEIKSYLDLVVDGELPVQQEIMNQLQDIFNLLPNLNMEDLHRAFAHKANDMTAVVYLSSLVRSVVSLHSLIDNKERLRAAAAAKGGAKGGKGDKVEGKEGEKEEEKGKDADKDKKEQDKGDKGVAKGKDGK